MVEAVGDMFAACWASMAMAIARQLTVKTEQLRAESLNWALLSPSPNGMEILMKEIGAHPLLHR